MSNCYVLVNWTRGEQITFGASAKYGELIGDPVRLALAQHYLLTHRGDLIAYVGMDNEEWPFPGGSRADLDTYRDVTEEVTCELLDWNILIAHPHGPTDGVPAWQAVYHEVERRIWEIAQRTEYPFPGPPLPSSTAPDDGPPSGG